MALRTSAPEVCAIIETDLTGDAILAFITPASVLVDEHLASVDPAIGDALLGQIETYLAAHFLTLFDPRTTKEEADGVRFTFEGKTDMALDSSKYGQMAQVLDPTGTLKQLSKANRVGWQVQVGNERDVEGLI
jgi:hypothetical protein